MENNLRTIQGVNVAVVGGCGFLGSHLVSHLIDDRQCNVLVIDNLSSGRREFVHGKAVFEHHDITGSENHLLKIFQQHQIEYCFNYAAHPYIPVSFARPLYVFDTNAMGALKVINAAQEAGCKGILQVSSAEIYGNDLYRANDRVPTGYPPGFKLSEEAPVQPHSTYGAAKAAIDSLIQVRWKEAKTPCIALRQFNCIGERETHPYVVPEIISQMANQDGEGGYVINLGNNSFRDFQYAGDAVRNAVLLLETERYGEVFNMGSEEGCYIYDLPHMVAKAQGLENVEIEIRTDPARVRPWEIWHLQSDNTKLWEAIGKQTHMSLEAAISHCVSDFNDNNGWVWEN